MDKESFSVQVNDILAKGVKNERVRWIDRFNVYKERRITCPYPLKSASSNLNIIQGEKLFFFDKKSLNIGKSPT